MDCDPDDLERHIGRVTALKAFEAASLGPDEIDLAEVHDATALGEVIQVENLGLAPRGEGGLAALQGHTALGGRTPRNPSAALRAKATRLALQGSLRLSNWLRNCAARQDSGRSRMLGWPSPKTAAGYGASRKPCALCQCFPGSRKR